MKIQKSAAKKMVASDVDEKVTYSALTNLNFFIDKYVHQKYMIENRKVTLDFAILRSNHSQVRIHTNEANFKYDFKKKTLTFNELKRGNFIDLNLSDFKVNKEASDLNGDKLVVNLYNAEETAVLGFTIKRAS